MSLDSDVTEAEVLADEMAELLAGKRPHIQGAALGQMLAKWIAGHYLMGPVMMDTMLAMHVDHTRQLIPLAVQDLKRRMTS